MIMFVKKNKRGDCGLVEEEISIVKKMVNMVVDNGLRIEEFIYKINE